MVGKVAFGLALSCAVTSCAIAAILVGRRVRSRRKWNRVVGVLREFDEGCSTSRGRLRQLVDAMAVEMHAGLASEGGSKLKMLLTFVDNLPNGLVRFQDASLSAPLCYRILGADSLSCEAYMDHMERNLFMCYQYALGVSECGLLIYDFWRFLLAIRSEKGIFYALDLGGTNFRVLRVQLGGKRSTILDHQVERQSVPQHLMTSTSEDLFDFIASTLEQFVGKEGTDFQLPPDKRQLGFTFSFPVRQTSVSSGILIKWTKGFAIEDMTGKDVAGCLQQALDKRGLDMRVAALGRSVMVTTSVQAEHDFCPGIELPNAGQAIALLGHYHDEDTVAAVIIGTGTNACYVERMDAIIKSQGLPTSSGVMGFEKMIAGMYLGDIVRRVIFRMAQESDLFGDVWGFIPPGGLFLCSLRALYSPPRVLARDTITFLWTVFAGKPMPGDVLHVTPLMAAMHEDDSPDLGEVARILRDVLQIPEVPLKVRRLVVRVCDIVTRRAARLAAAGIVGILKKVGRDGTGGIASGRTKGESSSKPRRTVVAVEGSLYTSYTVFREYLNEAVAEILGEEVARNVVLRASEDGSGIGAAFLAASHSSCTADQPKLPQ
ncbi:hypothetical protein ACLOJK_000413 [Asimina triloba]